MKPKFFPTPKSFRAWLERNHQTSKELLVGFYRKDSGKPSINWPEAVNEALCFGWIDGIRHRLDDTSYTIRFTPRRPRSTWSAININYVAKLRAQGLMKPAGLRAYEQRLPERSQTYSYERIDTATLGPTFQKMLRANKKAWAYFQTLTPSYRGKVIHWVVTAKKEETKVARLRKVIGIFAKRQRP